MTIMQRAATLAVMTFSLAALVGNSAPGWASELDRSAFPVTAPVTVVTAPTISASTNPVVSAVAPTSTDPVVEPSVNDDYDTLAQAVAAQDTTDMNEAQRCLAGAIYFEARGESLAGQLAVANVIINRSKSGRFPSDVCSVVTQRGQFSFVRGGEIPTLRNGAALNTAIAVAKVALAAAWDSPAPKALYFNTADRRPGGRLTRVAMIGNHVFYR